MREDAVPNAPPCPLLELARHRRSRFGQAEHAHRCWAGTYPRGCGLGFYDNAIYPIPVNLYASGDNSDPANSHVIPALIKKCIDARERGGAFIEPWGTGSESSELPHVEDAALGIVLAAERHDSRDPVNLGVGREVTIRDLVDLIVRPTGFKRNVRWGHSKPDGQSRRALDTSRARERFGFVEETSFEDRHRRTIEWY